MEPVESKVLNSIRRGQFKQLDLYLRHNYELKIVSKDGRNGLFFAMDIADARKRRRMIRFCLDHGIDPLHREKDHGYTPLHEAIARQQLDSVQILLANAGGEIDWRALDKRGRTLLHQAVEANDASIVKELVLGMTHYGISVDIPDRNGLTPFLLATKLHLREIAQILIDKGHASRQQCDTSMHHSVQEWQMIGLKEHREEVRNRLRQEIENAMQAGKINQVKKLKHVYYSPVLSTSSLSLSKNDSSHQYSRQSMARLSSLNGKSSTPIHEMIDQLRGGEIPETYVSSVTDEQVFHVESITSSTSSLPALPSNTRHHQSTHTLNALVDLFQVVQ
jgi:hypothetical protein